MYLEPWHGQSQVLSKAFQESSQPKCIHFGTILYSFPFSSLYIPIFKPLSFTILPSPGFISFGLAAGKSSLLNKLDPELNLKTDEISKALGRGKHTTRAIEFYKIDNAYVADTPGFSSLSFSDMTKEDIRDNFIEFNKSKEYCKYSDCMHIKENDCFIKELVKDNVIHEDRYNNYVSFIKEKEDEGISFNSKKSK